MRRGFLALGLATAALASLGADAPPEPKRRLALVGGMLLTGLDEPPVHHAAVVIEGDRIVAAGRASETPLPQGVDVIDTSGRTMLPGLIDLHAHLIILGHGDYDRWDPWIAENKLVERVMEISARQLLMAGVTSAVDLGGTLKESLSVRDRIRRGEIPGPRMWMSGPWITRDPGDYSPALDTQLVVDTPEQAAQAVERLARAGVDVIKAYVELKPAHYKAIVDTAHRHGLRVHAHVYEPEDVRNALEAGVDVLTHAGSAGTPPYEPDLVRAIAVRGTPVVVTAAHRVWVYPATLAFPERLQDPRLKEDFPPDLYREVQDSLRNFPRLKYFSTTDRQMFYGKTSLRQWIDAGAVMGMGTDSGTPLNFHTEALWREIKAHVDVGMPPQRAINAATRVNARILGREKDLGTLEAGKLADVIVVDGDPLFDVLALSRVEVVVKDGAVFKSREPERPGAGPR
ncbi:MAG TPA: amidohydrolase family protein [Vicinamibacteria bacterium]|nr:amidohydrolase family protein [Vicinamibacteria bacterium]